MVWPWISNDKKELGANQQIIWCNRPVVDSQLHGAGVSEALHCPSCPILGAALEMPVETSSRLQSLPRVKFPGANVNGKDRPVVLEPFAVLGQHRDSESTSLFQVLLPSPPVTTRQCSTLRQMQHQVHSSSA
jgi:hypothetical protein